MKLLSPDGSPHFVHDGETDRIADLLNQGYSRAGADPQSGSQQNAMPASEPLNPSSVSVKEIKLWLDTNPALSDVAAAFQMEQAHKHRKSALDALQDYMSDV